MSLIAEPRLLRCPDYGLVIEAKVGRVWSQVIARDAREVYVKRLPNAFIQKYAKALDYPKGIAEAANRFLNPALGIATVTPAAQLILESIMQMYTQKSNAVRALGKIQLGLLDRRDDFIKKTDDGNFELNDDAARIAAGTPQASEVRVDARTPIMTAEQVAAEAEAIAKRPKKKVKVEKTAAEQRQAAMKKGGEPKPATKKSAAPKTPRATRDDVCQIAIVGNQSKRRGNFGLICAAVTKGANTADKLIKQLPKVPEAYIGQAISWGLKNGAFETVGV